MKHDQTWQVDHSNQQLASNCAANHQTICDIVWYRHILYMHHLNHRDVDVDVAVAVDIDDVVVALVAAAVAGGGSGGGLSSRFFL